MRNLLLFSALLVIFYGCIEISGKEPFGNPSSEETAPNRPPDDLRVGKDEATKMRSRRGKDDAAVKISAQDLMSLMSRSPSANDSFIFYFVKYDDGEGEKKRYSRKNPRANWKDVSRKPSSLLVGYIGAPAVNQSMRLAPIPGRYRVSVYDLAVVCPPPPDCDCEIEQ